MRSELNLGTHKNPRLLIIIALATILLMVPLIAMCLTTEIEWTTLDFLVAAFLLFGTGLICEAVMRKYRNAGQRLIISAAVLIILFLLWAELAVGIFGSPIAGS